MIVYRKQEEATTPAECLKRIQGILSPVLRSSTVRHEEAAEVLIEWGAFESAVVDALFPEKDSCNDTSRRLRDAGLLAGSLFLKSWEVKEPCALINTAKRLSFALEEVSSIPLPGVIRLREPEGYAHYGLYPETYIEASRNFFHDTKPGKVACIGLRSIGTSLSLVAGATLEALGCKVTPLTMRPRGHPFNRYIRLSPEFEGYLKDLGCDFFLIADEGPGLSGTSFTSVAERLSGLGVPDDRIILFPSWVPDGSSFISEEARKRWGRHRKYASDFEDLWIKSGRLTEHLPASFLTSISAGMWRGLVYGDEKDYPPVHPHHEKRKYLCKGDRSDPMLMLRFAGLGGFGRLKLERASRLADEGFVQPVHGLVNGFLVTEFVEARPVARGDLNEGLLDFIALYLSFLSNAFQVERKMGFDEITCMIKRNTFLGLGNSWVERLMGLEAYRSVFEDTPAVALDGRMLPNEWLISPQGYLKADAFDHHRDQFFPCSQDIAWDLAGAIVEFGLAEGEGGYLVDRYRMRSGDKGIGRRLPFYTVAYLAFRIGYTTFAARELMPSPDGAKFKAQSASYTERLKNEIPRLGKMV